VVYLLVDGPATVVKAASVHVGTFLAMQQLCRYFYDVSEWNDADAVVSRATRHVGCTGDKLPFKDPHHFAVWCKTDSYQLHC